MEKLSKSTRFEVRAGKSRHDLYHIWDTKRKYVVGYFAYPTDAQHKADTLNKG